MPDQYKMKDSGVEWIGKVPEGWKVSRVKNIAVIRNGQDPKTEGEIPVYGSGDGSFKTCGEYKDGPAVLLGRKRATLHIPHYIEGKYWNVDTAFDVKMIDNNNLRWFYYLATRFDYRAYMSQTTLPSMTQSDYRDMAIPLPNTNEQQAIASYLDEKCTAIDSIIAQAKDTIEEYKAWRASVINDAVTKGLDPKVKMKDSGVEWIGKVPERWETKPLKFLATCNDDALSENTDPNFEFDYIDIGSVSLSNGIGPCERLQFRDAPSRARRIVKTGDVIVSTVRTYLKAIAQVGTFDVPKIASTGFAVIRAKNVNPNFLRYVLSSDSFVSMVEAESTGISYPAINASQLMVIKLPCPDTDTEQYLIAAYLDEKCAAIDGIVAEKQALIEELESYKKSLIYEVVTGKRKVS